MGIYAVTGGTKGIGEQTVKILRGKGHEVINIDVAGGDINGDLGTAEGRASVIAEVHRRCPDGLDGLVCNHGIAATPGFKLSYILSVNYFGAVAVVKGLHDLLKMKRGSCVVTISGSIANAKRGRYFVDELLTNSGDEARIGRLVDTFPPESAPVMYVSTKIALANWVRRVSSSWAAGGVNINAVGPGAVATTIMDDSKDPADYIAIYPMPAIHGTGRFMNPADVAQALAFFVLPEAKGFSGEVIFCDAGAAAIADTDKPC
jgi:NAD(P)-dependent dehydrogenase (short-subunit alcohol dehydrogenase family)